MLKWVTEAVRLFPFGVPPTSSKPPAALDQKRCAPVAEEERGMVTTTGWANVVPSGPN